MTVRKNISELKEQIALHGRTVWDSENGALFFNWTCSGFTVSFTGKRLRAKLFAAGDSIVPNDPSVFLPTFLPCCGTVISNGLSNRIQCIEGEQWITLWDGAAVEKKEIKLIKLSENNMGKLAVLELETDGEFETISRTDKRVMEFVGDSITCGFGNEAEGIYSPFRTSEENGWDSYGAITARRLGFEPSIICSSGICAVGSDKYTVGSEPMDVFYPFTDYLFAKTKGMLPEKWDFRNNTPDIIVINLGTNDADQLRRCSWLDTESLRKEFGERYLGFVKNIRERNGEDTLIFCVLGPMDYFLFPEIEDAVRIMNESGDNNVFSFRFSEIDPETEGYGCEAHPSVATHRRMAFELSEYIRSVLNR